MSSGTPGTSQSPRASGSNNGNSRRSVQIRRPPGAIKASAEKAEKIRLAEQAAPITPITMISLDKVNQGRKANEPTSPSSRPCRNVAIHGQCTKTGCPYNHNIQQQAPTTPHASPSKSSGNGRSSHTRMSSGHHHGQQNHKQDDLGSQSQISGQSANVNAPVFVPKSNSSKAPEASTSKMHAGAPTWTPSMPTLSLEPAASISRPATQQSNHFSAMDPSSRPFTPDSFGPLPEHHHSSFLHSQQREFFPSNAFQPNGNAAMGAFDGSFQPNEIPPPPPQAEFFNPYAAGQDMSLQNDPSNFYRTNRGDGTANQSGGYYSRQPVYYHLYQPPLPHAAAHNQHQLAMNAFFISPTLREDLQKRAEACVPVDGATEIPGYFGLVPLDAPSGSVSSNSTQANTKKSQQSGVGIIGLRNWVYRAMSEVDGQPYVLRRLEGYRLSNDTALGVVERWRRIRHPNIVNVREAFTTRGFNDSSLVFVFDYHPLSTTLYEAHLSPQAQAQAMRGPHHHHGRPNQSNAVPERVIWSYVIQLCNATKTIHSNGLAARTIEVSKILVTGRHRLRINCCSILDVVRMEQQADINNLQQEDLFDLAKVILSLACNSTSAFMNMPRSMDLVTRSYSADLHKLLLFLFSKPSARKSVDDAFAIIGSRVLDEMNAHQLETDTLESQLMRELENGRLVRLLCKFGFINERPEFDHDPRWAESGDRYVIKLFRDYVFHQVEENGRPVVDLSHVLTCLNKLDAGVEDRIMLVSRDSQNCLVVSYKEIKQAIEGAYRDLAR